MSFRRFLYLVADDCVERRYSLRRIDMSRLFFPRLSGAADGAPTPLDSSGGGATDPSDIQHASILPDPTLSVSSPESKHESFLIKFMLFEKQAHDGENSAVVTIDHTGTTLMCDPCSLAPAFLPISTVAPKMAPFSLSVGGSLYVMDAFLRPDGLRRRGFEALSYGRGRRRLREWYWHSLPLPPFVYEYAPRHGYYSHIESYAVVAGTDILVSNKAKHTYRFDTARGEWSKAGDWPMPFTFLAEYVPEHRLWFGISSRADSRFVAANLVASPDSEEIMMGPPVVHGSWKEHVRPPPEWSLVHSQAVHLGSSKFCIVRFFEVGELRVCPEIRRTCLVEEEIQVVLTGVEVESRGQELRVLKHKCERYKLNLLVDYWVL